MRASNVKSATALTAALVLAACSGGAGGGATSTPTIVSVPPESAGHATMSLSFTVPSASSSSSSLKKKPAYVSTASTQAVVTILTVNGVTPPASVAPNPLTVVFATSGAGQNCTVSGTTETCTFDVPAPAGSVAYKLDVEDSAGDVLSTGTQTFTVTAGTANALSMTLDAAPFVVTLAGPTLTAGTAAAARALTIAVTDPGGGSIPSSPAQTFTTPITITDGDTTGATALLLNTTTGTGSASVQMTSSADVVNITYTGLAVPTFAVTASGTGVSGSMQYSVGNSNLVYWPIVPTGTTACTTTVGCSSTDPNYNAPTAFINSVGGTATFGASETGWSDFGKKFTATLDPTTCSGVATLTGSPGTSFTATGVAAGICSVNIADGLGRSKTVYVSVTTTGIGVN